MSKADWVPEIAKIPDATKLTLTKRWAGIDTVADSDNQVVIFRRGVINNTELNESQNFA
jgi:hypothetical protein